MSNHSIKLDVPTIPSWLVVTQAVCFAILYAVWMLPKTTFLRNSCLGLGAFLSIFVVFRFRKAFLNKAAIPVYLLIALYVWLIFHLLFLSNDFEAQYLELTSVWKNSAIGIVFGLGFGISLVSMATRASDANLKGNKDSRVANAVWVLIWIGLIAPEVIYLIKWLVMRYGIVWGLDVPDYLKLWPSSAPYYISKNTYVCFCLPVLAIALGQIKHQVNLNRLMSFANIFYVGVITSALFVFWGEKIFNGYIYSFMCAIILCSYLLWGYCKQAKLNRQLLVILFMLALIAGLSYLIKKDVHFQSFLADAKIATQLEKYPQWKYNGEQVYPQNEIGSQVNGSNYERLSWLTYGVQLIPRHPLGYGLLQSSFGHLVKIDYPDSKMHQSHSGWLDLALGIGLPGASLILSALLLAVRNCANPRNIISEMSVGSMQQLQAYLSLGRWSLLGLGLIWCTTELSQRLYIDSLLFWIALATGLGIGSRMPKIGYQY